MGEQPNLPPVGIPKPNTLDDRIRLSSIFERMRAITNDKEINNKLQDKKYMELAIEMSELARLGHEANGILFGFHMRTHTHVLEEVYDRAGAEIKEEDMTAGFSKEVRDKVAANTNEKEE